MDRITHFANVLAKELAGSFSDTVWAIVLPRAAHHEPAIWHGMLAVSILDKSLRVSSNHKPDYNSASIMHYSKAIQELHIRLADQGQPSCKDVILLSCILFAVFECLHGHYQSALRHISGGMQLLTAWENETHDDEGGVYLDRTTLHSIFLCLDSQAIQLGASEFRDNFAVHALDDQLHTAQFANLDDAHLFLNQIFHRVSHLVNWIDPAPADRHAGPSSTWIKVEREHIGLQLHAWDDAFRQLVWVQSDQPAAHLLSVGREVLNSFLGRHVDGSSELDWDQYLPNFEKALEHAEIYLDLVGKPSAKAMPSGQECEKPQRPALTIAMDVVMPLFLISTKCRQSNIRHRALTLLQQANRREGIWDSSVIANTAAKLIGIEEKQATADDFIPEHARIIMLDVSISDDRSAHISTCVQSGGDYHCTGNVIDIATGPGT